MQRPDLGQGKQLVVLAPVEEPLDDRPVGRPGVGVADGGEEEFQSPLEGTGPGELDGNGNVLLQLGRDVVGCRHRDNGTGLLVGYHEVAIRTGTDAPAQ